MPRLLHQIANVKFQALDPGVEMPRAPRQKSCQASDMPRWAEHIQDGPHFPFSTLTPLPQFPTLHLLTYDGLERRYNDHTHQHKTKPTQEQTVTRVGGQSDVTELEAQPEASVFQAPISYEDANPPAKHHDR